MRFARRLWTIGAPLAAFALVMATWGRPLSWLVLAVIAAALIAAVFVAVHHAEVVAHRVGEPFGTLVLALAITVIETSLLVSMMVAGGPGAEEIARDTLFATVMIICNGVIGLCLLVGSLRHHVVEFRVDGTSPALSVLAALTAMTLVLPSLTTTAPGPEYSRGQLIFAGVMSLVLYSVFVFVQTVRHRDYFLPVGLADEEHASVPTSAAALTSLALLFLSLVAVVGLSKTLSPAIGAAVQAASAPAAVVGIVIALLVLLPETFAALRAAARNRMQTSLNLALGSALASIGLTIPAVAAAATVLGQPLALGLSPKETALLAITLLISAVTLVGGRATVLQGAVHLVIFLAFLFLSVVP